MKAHVITLLLLVASLTLDGSRATDDYNEDELNYIQTYAEAAKQFRLDSKFRAAVLGLTKTPRNTRQYAVENPFACNTELSKSVPESVHNLRPSDIKVVGAMGDEFTAGQALGVTDELWRMIVQFRGESWSMGGDWALENNTITLPNILRKFSPNLKGASRCMVTFRKESSHLNVARFGASAKDMMEQADELIGRMKNDTEINFEQDWKLVTILVGKKDLCESCKEAEAILYTAAAYHDNMQSVLDKLHAELPRAFVNLVPMWDVTYINDAGDAFDPGEEPLNVCEVLNQRVGCDCVRKFKLPNNPLQPDLDAVLALQVEYTDQLTHLTSSGRYDSHDGFTVVLQPQTTNFKPPKVGGTYDPNYFVMDCTSPSRLWHQWFAHTLWNGMMTRVGEKPETTTVGQYESYFCPSQEHPYLFTAKNSLPATPVPTIGGVPGLRAGIAAMSVVVMTTLMWIISP